jgi:beta-alanine--pyruvate transaminase
VRNLGLIGAIELEAMPGEATRRAFSAFLATFEKGLLIRTTGDIVALFPPLIILASREIDQIVETLSGVLKGLP